MDAHQGFRVVRAEERQFFPVPSLARRIDALAREIGAHVIFLDPWLPLGHLGPRLTAAPYVTIVHGAEVTVPGRLPGTRRLGGRVLRAAAGVVAAGHYPAREAERAAGRALRGVIVPPGVDVERFRPLDAAARAATRREFGLDPDRPLVLGVSRLVPRKGFDVLIDAVAGLPGVQLAIAGAGRDRHRLEARVTRRGLTARVRFLGRVPDDDRFPRLYASADVFAAPCRDRWGGLEAEGFGIVFLEAAAAGVPSVAGRSGGSHEAVVDGETGFVVESRAPDVRAALGAVLADDELRERMGVAARRARGRRVLLRRPGGAPRADRGRGPRRPREAGLSAGTLGAVPDAEIDLEALARAGRRILVVGWVANALFAATAIPVALGFDDVIGVAIGVALFLFLVAVGTFVYAFGVGVARTTRGDNVAVANLFFLQGSAPRPVRRAFLVLFLVCLAITVGTVAWEPFGVLVPMLPIGLAGVWAARYGVFPPRPPTLPRRRM